MMIGIDLTRYPASELVGNIIARKDPGWDAIPPFIQPTQTVGEVIANIINFPTATFAVAGTTGYRRRRDRTVARRRWNRQASIFFNICRSTPPAISLNSLCPSFGGAGASAPPMLMGKRSANGSSARARPGFPTGISVRAIGIRRRCPPGGPIAPGCAWRYIPRSRPEKSIVMSSAFGDGPRTREISLSSRRRAQDPCRWRSVSHPRPLVFARKRSPTTGGTIQYGHEQEPPCLAGPWINNGTFNANSAIISYREPMTAGLRLACDQLDDIG